MKNNLKKIIFPCTLFKFKDRVSGKSKNSVSGTFSSKGFFKAQGLS